MAANPKSPVKSKTASKNKQALKPDKKIGSGGSDISRLSEDMPSNAEAEKHKEWNVAQSEERIPDDT